jgi:hypothetical protein
MFSKSVTRRSSLFGLVAGAAAFPFGGAARAAPASPSELVVLTVGGLVGAPNRRPFDQKRDRFFYHNNIEFRDARTFTASDLLALPQQTVPIKEEKGETTYKGPLLSDVLALAQPLAGAKTARLSALDSYATELPLDVAQAERWTLALEADGNAFGIGDFGPIYAVRPLPSGEKKTEEEDARWVFSLYYIELMP